MATFVPGSGALGLQANLYQVAFDNGCSEFASNNVSLWEQWNISYAFSPEFNAPYNMGFFYGQGCPAILAVQVNFYADPYNDNMASWGVYYKVGTTGTETLIDNLSVNRATYDDCVEFDVTLSTKGGVGQSGNTVYVGIRAIGKAATPAYYDAIVGGTGCPNTLNNDYGGTYDYPGSCPGQYSDFVESTVNTKVAITVAVNKSGFVSTC